MIDYVFEKYSLTQMPGADKTNLHISLDLIAKIDNAYVGIVSGLLATYLDEVTIEEYEFNTKQGVICIYRDGNVYNLRSAYELGIISLQTVRIIYEVYN